MINFKYCQKKKERGGGCVEAAKVTRLGIITLYIYRAVPLVRQSNKYSEGPSLTSLLCSARDTRAPVLLLCPWLASVSSVKLCLASSTVRYAKGGRSESQQR